MGGKGALNINSFIQPIYPLRIVFRYLNTVREVNEKKKKEIGCEAANKNVKKGNGKQSRSDKWEINCF